MIEEAQVLSTFFEQVVDEQTRFSARVREDYALVRCQWVSNNVNNPNYNPDQGVFRIAAEAAVLDAIEADPNYTLMTGTRGPYNG